MNVQQQQNGSDYSVFAIAFAKTHTPIRFFMSKEIIG